MITIRKIIERVDRVKPNAISPETKLGWVAELDGKIALDVLLMDRSELSQFNYEYPDALKKEPLVSFPHDAIYDKWLIAQIDAACEEWERYANDIEVYNSYFKNYVRWIASTFQPAQGGMERCGTYPRYFLTAYGLAVMQGFVGTLDEWLQSLKGEPGSTPVVGEDYFTETDKRNMLMWIREQMPNQTLELDASLTLEGYAADAKKTGSAIENRVPVTRKINGKPLSVDMNLTAIDVGARPANWMPSIEEIGAAPAGYGLGTGSVAIDDLNAFLVNGWGWIGADTKNAPSGLAYASVHVTTRLNNQIVQTLTGINQNRGCQIVRTSLDGGSTWIDEYVNPPMLINTEYRTTERWGGKPVYVKRISFGALPASGSSNVSTGISGGTLVSLTGTFYLSGGGAEPYPIMGGAGTKCLAWVNSDCSILYTQAILDCSNHTGEFVIKYTKN